MKTVALLFLFLTHDLYAFVRVPGFTPNIVDPDSYLTSEEREEVNDAIERLRTKSDVLAAVYVLKSLEGEAIEDLAGRTFKKWELGQAGKDNGLLLILAMNDRRNRIEVGYGLEGQLPDIICSRILQKTINPHLKENNLKSALLAGLSEISLYATGEKNADKEIGLGIGKKSWIAYLVLLLIGFIIYLFRTEKFQIGSLLVVAFLALNPGLFIYLLADTVTIEDLETIITYAGGTIPFGFEKLKGSQLALAFISHVSLNPILFGLFSCYLFRIPSYFFQLQRRSYRDAYLQDEDILKLNEEMEKFPDAFRITFGSKEAPVLPLFPGYFFFLTFFFLAGLLIAGEPFLRFVDYSIYLVPIGLFSLWLVISLFSLRIFKSKSIYKKFLEAKLTFFQYKFENYKRLGHATVSDDGKYSYTPSYYSSRSSSGGGGSRSSSGGGGSRSSSGGGGSRSSSGGGSSGGGGSSSSW